MHGFQINHAWKLWMKGYHLSNVQINDLRKNSPTSNEEGMRNKWLFDHQS